MGWDFYLAMGCLLGTIVLGISLAISNCNNAERVQANLEARRAYKKYKNERLRRFYGLDKKD